MTKRIASFILVLILALGLLPFGALADETGGAEIIASGDCSSQLNPDSVSWKLDSNGLLTISGKGYMNYYGLSLSETAPWGTDIKSVVVESGVLDVGARSFYHCDKLKSVTLSESVDGIGNSAFEGCTSLRSIDLPDSLEYICDSLFKGCTALESVVIPEKVIEIREQAFEGCTNLTEVYFPDSLKDIKSGAFEDCHKLKSVTIPDNAWMSGSYIFARCYSLESVKLSTKQGTIGDNTFLDCTNLKSLTIGKKFISADSFAFGMDINGIYYNGTPYANVPYLNDVYYAGSPTEWKNIEHCKENFHLARVHYNDTGSNHKYTDTIYPASCTSTGRIEHVCTCGIKYTEYLCELGHEFVANVCVRCGASASTDGFTDISSDKYYFDAVNWAVGNGITLGTTASTFSPNDVCTRAQIVTFLWRAAGRPVYNDGFMKFDDVPQSAYYYNAVKWAERNNITEGTDSTHFSPNATCTRAQIVTLLMRANRFTDDAPKVDFVDVTVGSYYYKAVCWATKYGVTLGTDATHFSPNAGCTRAQVVTFLYPAKDL